MRRTVANLPAVVVTGEPLESNDALDGGSADEEISIDVDVDIVSNVLVLSYQVTADNLFATVKPLTGFGITG